MEPATHPQVEPIVFLLGTWRGEGKGDYPTIEPFGYGEEIRWWHVGKPFLAYAQRTWALDDGRPLHAETGYWRPQPDGRLELVMAHPTGIAEIAEGRVIGTSIELTGTRLAATPTAKEVTEVERSIQVEGDVLRYDLRMAAVGEPLLPHLRAELRRTGT
jgi:hypothetical protein